MSNVVHGRDVAGRTRSLRKVGGGAGPCAAARRCPGRPLPPDLAPRHPLPHSAAYADECAPADLAALRPGMTAVVRDLVR